MSTLQRLLASQPVRFLVCGAVAAAVNWFARMGLSGAMSFEQAVISAYAVGMCVGFVLYRTIVWPDHGTGLRQQVVGFLVVNAASAAIVFAATMLVRASLPPVFFAPGLADAMAHAAGIAVGALANFAGHKLFTFRAASTPPSRDLGHHAGHAVG